MKKLGTEQTVEMIATYSTILLTSSGPSTQNGTINCPKAAPKGLARLTTAVAVTLPLGENQRSEYLAGAERTNGWARPVRICPNATTPKMPSEEAWDPAYRIQFPARTRAAAAIIEGLGPTCRA
jgi:hypothetical protein